MGDYFNLENLVGFKPSKMLLHGPSKLLLNEFHWHEPKLGIIASYTPQFRDVQDHFGVFRGVDQIEAFAQATVVSCGTFLECTKLNCDPEQLKERFVPAFISIGTVNFHNYLTEGETFISVGKIKFYKFRQMVCDGRIYKAPPDLGLTEYFKDFNESRLNNYDLGDGFTLVAELSGVTGRALKKETFISHK